MARGKKQAVDAGSVEGPWELPDGWRWERLGALVEKISRKHQPSKVSDLPFVGLEHIPPHEMRLEGVGAFADMRSAGSAFEIGDVLYGRLRPYLNKVWVADRAGACSGELLVLRPKQGVMPRYVALLLHSQRYVYYASHIVTGDRPRIDFDLIGAFPVPVPSEEVQQAIVARIDALFAEIEVGEAALAEARSGVETYRKALLKAAVTGELTADWRSANPPQETGEQLLARILSDRRARWQADPKNARKKYTEPTPPDTEGLPELPEGWAWASMDQLGFVSGGLTQNSKRQALPQKFPFLRVANVYANRLDMRVVEEIGLQPSEFERVRLVEGDLLVVEGNGSLDQIGRSCLWDGSIEDCVHQNHLIKVRFAMVALGPWIQSWLQSPHGRRELEEQASSTSGLHTLSISKIGRLRLPIPSYDEMLQAQRLRDLAAGQQATATTYIDAEQARSSTLRQSILAAAFRGDLVI